MIIVAACRDGVGSAGVGEKAESEISVFGGMERAEQVQAMALIVIRAAPLAGKIVVVCRERIDS